MNTPSNVQDPRRQLFAASLGLAVTLPAAQALAVFGALGLGLAATAIGARVAGSISNPSLAAKRTARTTRSAVPGL